MATCGHTICPDEDCGWTYLFNSDRRDNCRRVQGCFEDSCSSLKALGSSGFLLYDACLGHCHRAETDPQNPRSYPTVEAYLCQNFDPVALVDYFGIQVCGVGEGASQTGQAQAAAAQAQAQRRRTLWLMALVIVMLLIVLLWKHKNR